MKDLTYNRPYQYVEDLRLFACYRSKDHAVFVGQGFADNAVAYIENGPMLTKLEQQGKVVHGDFDQLITQSFDVNMPFRIYVVNPDDENGKASNAIEYTESPEVPVLNVMVDDKSVVKDQIAYIDLTGKLNVIMKPNKIYGTDIDGKEIQFDRVQIEGIQHFFLNGDELPVDMGNVRAIDIAKESKTVQRVDTPLQLYGTNQNGVDATYPKDFFATSESVVNATKDIADLQENKQDKDKNAKDGYIAIMSNGQTVGSDTSLKETLEALNKAVSALSDLTDKVSKGLEKDWKATTLENSIANHPVGNNSIVITDKPIADENPIRNTPNAIVYGLQPDSVSQNGAAFGSHNSVGESASAFGTQAKAKGKNSISLGAMSEGDGENSIALGAFSNAKSAKGVAIGPTSSVTGSNSIAIGADSVADADNTVSVGFDTKDPNLKSAYRRITAVDTPVNDHDAVNKIYVDSRINVVESQTDIVFIGDSYFNGVGTSNGYSTGMAKKAADMLGLYDHPYASSGSGYLVGGDRKQNFYAQIQTADNDTTLDKKKVKYVVIGGGRNDGGSVVTGYYLTVKQTILKAAELFPFSKIIVIPTMYDNGMPDKMSAEKFGSFYRIGNLGTNITIVNGAYTWGFGEGSDKFSDIHPSDALSAIYGGYIADCCEHLYHDYFIDKQWHQENTNVGPDFRSANAVATLNHGVLSVAVRGQQNDASDKPGKMVTMPNLPKMGIFKDVFGYDDQQSTAPLMRWDGNEASCVGNIFGQPYAGRVLNATFTYGVLGGV